MFTLKKGRGGGGGKNVHSSKERKEKLSQWTGRGTTKRVGLKGKWEEGVGGSLGSLKRKQHKEEVKERG